MNGQAATEEPSVAAPADPVSPGHGGRAWRRASAASRRHKPQTLGVLILAAFVVVAIAGPWITPYSVHAQSGPVFGAPSGRHLLGLDDGGIDVLSEVIAGARPTIEVGLAAALVALLIGATIGIVAGYCGGLADNLLMRVTDYFIVVPALPLMIVIASLWGASLGHVILVIGALLWTTTARVLRSQVLSVKERLFVVRARSMGASGLHIIRVHIIPEVTGLIAANTVLTVAVAVFMQAALSFLGLGDPTSDSWGQLIQNAFERSAISANAWWAIVAPGVCIALVVLGCSLIGLTMEDAWNPRLRGSHLARKPIRIARPQRDAAEEAPR